MFSSKMDEDCFICGNWVGTLERKWREVGKGTERLICCSLTDLYKTVDMFINLFLTLQYYISFKKSIYTRGIETRTNNCIFWYVSLPTDVACLKSLLI